MATKNKTTETEVSVSDFIASFVESEQKKTDSFKLIELMQEWSGYEAKMWGPSIIGFGSHHYKYASGHEGDMPLIAFSPRKAAFSFYIYTSAEESKLLLKNLGKFKMGKACIYVNKLADIDLGALEQLCKAAIAFLQKHPETAC
ncbi:protein of unknown function (DU1801) [Algoriphagus locisalis]|uniref:YdhG-like domain-containing protein n=1 Tax=Algoriphagus locisalis TaxID=305507 RepID=A0A1I7BU47_9BACT|nr:DUF1801 domain-containing protein [Algoriphagus locisalis]SFT90726.1 protein of unknown function (DU1801) [Algoriphagus locisalis]